MTSPHVDASVGFVKYVDPTIAPPRLDPMRGHGVLRSGQPFDINFEKKKLAFQDGI
jgi:hypothetical protein